MHPRPQVYHHGEDSLGDEDGPLSMSGWLAMLPEQRLLLEQDGGQVRAKPLTLNPSCRAGSPCCPSSASCWNKTADRFALNPKP